MSLFVIEGARKSGKTFFVNSQKWIPVFKFDFNGVYTSLDLPAEGEKTHHIGLGKELMVQQLNRDGFLPDLMMDRGVITNSVWGILNKRVSKESVYQELDYMLLNGLFKNTFFFLITGTSGEKREKDVWDYMDEKIPEETALFLEFTEYLSERGVKIQIVENHFNAESLSSFQTIIKNLK
ncbi:MAG: hypothetical protein ACR2IJ_01040 [Fluviibacter sp.]